MARSFALHGEICALGDKDCILPSIEGLPTGSLSVLGGPCYVPTQKSYSSTETLKAYDHDTRMHYGNRVTDLVHRESDEFPRQGTNFTLAELGICEPSPHRSDYCSDIGILHQGYSLSTGSDADSDIEGGMSPEHAIRLWGRGIKSRRSSGLSSRENSALTLTDSDNENKSDEENGRPVSSVNSLMYLCH
ncbi:PREDICTED: teneurin-2-like [Gekko japonicus]|uniref:Teneurin-2-like n=1 Tax=Gekko japonicus TaxID=146911 RepID=A0ABM1KMM3_GEKJA|nr:PREDICTED: teneurin-2-like [Gekko japonicus]